ncbi:TROVE domain-containing protein [Haliangium sp.]|uniref:TROVE domain-containing protein n=1 Tax=Haliangium sp. TaxID=2663208 RepID=UPI003D149625
MSINYGKILSGRDTPQSQPLPDQNQVRNSAGGYVWEVDDWTQLDRFLVLGSEGGSYYASQRELTLDNAQAVKRCLAADGVRTVDRVVEISRSGRAPKNDPATFVLALAAKTGEEATRQRAFAALPEVCRTGTHLMRFADYCEAFGGWGRGMRRAVAGWYNDKPADKLAYQLVKYQRRDGWSHRDLLRLTHPKAGTPAHDQLFRWATRGELVADADGALAMLEAFEQAKRATTASEIVRLIEQVALPREAVPTRWLTHAKVWEALLVKMPMTAMIRNLAVMTRVGLLASMSEATRTVVSRLESREALRRARVHPIAVLAALMTYKAGRGARGQHTWTPVGKIVDALDRGFYNSFGAVQPAGKRTLLALDVSGSMGWGTIAGIPGLTPRVASAAMALVTAATEPDYTVVAFSTSLRTLDISPRQRLDAVLRRTAKLPFGGTDCAQPMLWAQKHKVPVETFVVYTDSETWYGKVHPAKALERYRHTMGIPAKLIVVGMVSNGFSIADPNDTGMLDVVGFDTAAPNLMSDFARA